MTQMQDRGDGPVNLHYHHMYACSHDEVRTELYGSSCECLQTPVLAGNGRPDPVREGVVTGPCPAAETGLKSTEMFR